VFGYWLALVMVAAALVLSLALPNTRFRTASALQELHQRGDLGKSDSAAS
jgi:hypothetical protein